MNPLFGNDLVGLIKFLSIIVGVVLLPLAALVIYFLKRTDLAKETATQKDMDGLGARVNALDVVVRSVAEQVSALDKAMRGAQSDTLTAIQAMSEAQIRATHAIDKEVAVLKERNDLGECLAEFGKSIQNLAIAIRENGGSR